MIYGDPWQILGLPPGADKHQAKRAYRSLARQYHPDVDSGSKAQERWLQISWAWEIIINDRQPPLVASPARWEYVLASLFSTPRRIEVDIPGPLPAGSYLQVPIDDQQRTVVISAASRPGQVLSLPDEDQELFLFLRSSESESSG